MKQIQDGIFPEKFAVIYELGLEIPDEMKEMSKDRPIAYLEDVVGAKLGCEKTKEE